MKPGRQAGGVESRYKAVETKSDRCCGSYRQAALISDETRLINPEKNYI